MELGLNHSVTPMGMSMPVGQLGTPRDMAFLFSPPAMGPHSLNTLKEEAEVGLQGPWDSMSTVGSSLELN